MFDLKLENENANIVNLNDGVRYLIIGASGLTPPSASIYTSSSPNRKGVRYNGSTLNERHIVLTIKILGDVEANRNALYDWIETELYCKVHYSNGLKKVYCEGHVEDCTSDFFTSNEVMSVAIVCENPYWKELSTIFVEITSLVRAFTIPFAIKDEGIPFSYYSETNETKIVNTGAETGIKILIRCSGEVKNLVIYDARDTTRRFTINTTLAEGSLVEIDTESSPKRAVITALDGTKTNLMQFLGGNSKWFTLKKGLNIFGYIAEEGANNVEMTIEYSNKHLGV